MKRTIYLVILLAISTISRAQSGYINSIAGNSNNPGYTGDGGLATTATLDQPIDVAVDFKGNVFIADKDNNAIRKINTSGIITTIAGPAMGYGGDGGLGTAAQIHTPYGITVDKYGNVYFADYYNNVIRKVDTNDIITTVAGNGYGYGTAMGGNTGDGGPATAAEMATPMDVAVDTFGSLFISDQNGSTIRCVNYATGVINTIGGGGTGTVVSSAGLPATSVLLSDVTSVAVDYSDNVFLTEANENRVMEITPTGTMYNFAGFGSTAFTGANTALGTGIGYPEGVNTDKYGNVYITDYYNSLIYVVLTINDSIYPIAGMINNYTSSGDGGPALNASIDNPYGVCVDLAGNVYFPEYDGIAGNDIRKVNAYCLANTSASYSSTGVDSFRSFTYTGTTAYIDSIVWTFGDGTTATGTNPTHIYTATGTYNACVTVYSQCGPVDTCETITITSPSTSIINVNGGAMNVYPNPAKDQLSVSGITETTTYSLQNITGTTLQKGTLQIGSNNISLHDYPAGLYFLELIDSDGQKNTAKVIKQ